MHIRAELLALVVSRDDPTEYVDSSLLVWMQWKVISGVGEDRHNARHRKVAHSLAQTHLRSYTHTHIHTHTQSLINVVLLNEVQHRTVQALQLSA